MKQFIISEECFTQLQNLLTLRFVCDTDINLTDNDSGDSINLLGVLDSLAEATNDAREA